MESGGDLLLGDGSYVELPPHTPHRSTRMRGRLGLLRCLHTGSTICKTFQIIGVADSIRLERLPVVVCRHIAMKGGSTTFGGVTGARDYALPLSANRLLAFYNTAPAAELGG